MTPSVGETSKERRKMETKNKREEMRGKLGECDTSEAQGGNV